MTTTRIAATPSQQGRPPKARRFYLDWGPIADMTVDVAHSRA